MYQSLMVTFSVRDGVTFADVYRKQYPDGRQRRFHVARYQLDLPQGEQGPQALLAALQRALNSRPKWTLGTGA